MKHFTTVVKPIGRFALQLTFPDLPGCSSTAYSWEGVESSACEALNIMLEKQPFIVPAPMAMVRTWPEVQKAISEGAQLVLITHVAPFPTKH